MKIVHHGAANGVTGSCHQLIIDNINSKLIDCGLFQEDEQSQLKPIADSLEIEFDISTIRALIVTHCHIDHVGRIPYLLAAGFRGPIYASTATTSLLPLVIEDALKVGVTRNKSIIDACLKRLKMQLIALDYKCWQSLDLVFPVHPKYAKGDYPVHPEREAALRQAQNNRVHSAHPEREAALRQAQDNRVHSVHPERGAVLRQAQDNRVHSVHPEREAVEGQQTAKNPQKIKIKLQRAGHILGSAYVEIDIKSNTQAKSSHRVVFSGDLGAPYAPLLPTPKSPYRADTLVIESTYGDKNHANRRNRKKQ